MRERFPSCLNVEKLTMSLFLGHGEEERSELQDIDIAFTIYFRTPPKVSEDDRSSFLCYDQLSRAIMSDIEQKEFRYIEYVAHRAYEAIRDSIAEQLPALEDDGSYVWVRVRKVPPVPYRMQSASYEYTDLPSGLAGENCGKNHE